MTVSPSPPRVVYPESDGQPMAENTQQFRWIVLLKENLEWLFAGDPQVFVAGDLLWYPVEGDPTVRVAPDVMVALGRPKGDRGSYLQWQEDNIPPQVVFEILSPGNTLREMAQKLKFYERHGVEEYYLYDPDRNDFLVYLRQETELLPFTPDGDGDLQTWHSPRLGIDFRLTSDTLEVFYPNGQPFLSTLELQTQMEQVRQQAEAERERAEVERERAEAERVRAEAERVRAEVERERADRLAAQLRALGINPDLD